ncbi:hexokinase-2-like protein [Leptotrombidium deliense]|uniref:Phosphotransferase n=1 Tax=Leptotrombidium deliense TaxID=299467 RepID=A0A443S9G6_9ACAR|nr:hexokinase-2-like protein [Leptotrombidium deliense]
MATIDKERFDKADELTKCFIIEETKLRETKTKLNSAFEVGLRDEQNAVVKMLITYVRSLPTGEETGPFLALDLGGTNFRVLLITLEGVKATQINKTYAIERELRTGEGIKLFDHIATCLFEFIESSNIKAPRLPLGFTFSFPCRQLGLTTAELIRWTKGFEASGVVNEDIVKLLRQAILRQQSKSRVFVDVVAVINDTTGSLMSCAHSNNKCAAGLIVGTGFNMCYLERLEKIDKWTTNYTEPKQVVINTEMGAFGEGNVLESIINKWDKEVDKNSLNPQKQLFEKLVSGMYMGEIAKEVLVTLCNEKLVFKGQLPKVLNEKWSFGAKNVSKVDGLANNDINKMKKIFGEVDETDVAIIRMVCSRISTRSAHLAAVACSTILERMERTFCVIAYDGSVIRLHPTFKETMRAMISKLTDEKYKFDLMLSEDGSGKGAAIVAAVVYKEKRPVLIKRGRKVYELSVFRRYAVN